MKKETLVFGEEYLEKNPGLFKDDSFRIFPLSPKCEEGAREYKRKKP